MYRRISLLVAVLLLAASCAAPKSSIGAAPVDVLVSRQDPDANFVFAAYDNVTKYFYNPAAVDHVKMLNAGLDGLAVELNNYNIKYSPEKIAGDTSLGIAQQQFSSEMARAKKLASGVSEMPERQLAFAATDAMLNSLDDSHTYFVAPPPSGEPSSLLGGYIGIGIMVKQLGNDFYYISRVISDGPADKAGLRRFDRLTAIDGKPLSGQLSEIIPKIRGKKGTAVELTVERKGIAMKFNVVRDVVPKEIASGVIFEENGHVYTYIALHEFDIASAPFFYQAVELGQKHGSGGIILDLRGNPGGLISVMEAIIGSVVPKGTAMYIRHSRGGWETRVSQGSGSITAPLVVLVDETSYSASELTASAIQEAKRARIIGKKSGGAVGVGWIRELPYGASMMVTVAEVFTASLKPMEKNGVDPDVPVELTKDNIIQGEDSQLAAAIKELEKMLEK